MNIEDIKVGETYYVRVKVTAISTNRLVCQPLLLDGTMSDFAPNYFNFAEDEAFYKSIPDTTPPKCDPCRLFRKGDKVRVVENKGRKQACFGSLATVKQDEDEDKVLITIDGSGIWWVDAAYLELVTPVEEQEPYHINEIFDIDDGNLIGYEVAHSDTRESIFYGGETHIRSIEKAKEAAEAERDRLNAEYRKEQE